MSAMILNEDKNDQAGIFNWLIATQSRQLENGNRY
jgi:hypothetical protein